MLSGIQGRTLGLANQVTEGIARLHLKTDRQQLHGMADQTRQSVAALTGNRQSYSHVGGLRQPVQKRRGTGKGYVDHARFELARRHRDGLDQFLVESTVDSLGRKSPERRPYPVSREV